MLYVLQALVTGILVIAVFSLLALLSGQSLTWLPYFPVTFRIRPILLFVLNELEKKSIV